MQWFVNVSEIVDAPTVRATEVRREKTVIQCLGLRGSYKRKINDKNVAELNVENWLRFFNCKTKLFSQQHWLFIFKICSFSVL
jgi:hypothetical protein